MSFDKKSWLLASRPKTLVATIAPIFVGTSLAYQTVQKSHGHFHFYLSLFALISTIFIQIGTNLINDALDFKKGADNAERLGPTRVTQSGMLTSKQVLIGAILCFVIATIFGIPLVLAGGWPILILGCFSLLFGYLYTGGPYPLAYIGLGELFVLLFFGFGAICGMHYVLTKTITLHTCIASLQIGLLAMVLISINNFRDYITDKSAQKKTLASRFGPSFARVEIISLFFLAFLLNFYWLIQGFYFAAFSPFIALPICIKVSKAIIKEDPSPNFNRYLGMSAGAELLFSIALSLGFYLA